ncbi:MAG: hypothetical protein U1E86_20475 [Burkholderiaceae bacterium]
MRGRERRAIRVRGRVVANDQGTLAHLAREGMGVARQVNLLVAADLAAGARAPAAAVVGRAGGRLGRHLATAPVAGQGTAALFGACRRAFPASRLDGAG